MSETIGVRLPDELIPELDSRAEAVPEDARVKHGRGPVVADLLTDHLALLAYTRRDLRRRELFSREECAIMLDALNGTLHTPGMIGELAIEIEDAIDPTIGGLTGTAPCAEGEQGQRLVEKLQALTPTEELCLLDAAGRWWKRAARGEQPDYGELLR